MEQIETIVSFLNSELDIKNIKDSSQNGLQCEGAKDIKKIVFGVSISLKLIEKAIQEKADMIITHHGLLWGRSNIFQGPFKKKLRLLFKNNINLLAYHLPLDKHIKVGNNAQIMNYLGAKQIKPFGSYDKETIGFKGSFSKQKQLDEIVKILSDKLNSKVLCLEFGQKKIKTLGVISGGAQNMFNQAIEENLDLYITGEISEFVQETARENNINFISAGHYNSEKPGIWALEKLIKAKFKVETKFIDVPNPI
ncbi:MAG: Nif3-like dinuclear metal center hexameric protein [Elusimicrobia bacterium]|nr:Nif3-like dinuclear metal center hexameric protein [Elusimicrobiota bacterium]